MKPCVEFEHHLVEYFIIQKDAEVRVVRREDGTVMFIKIFPLDVVITLEEIMNVMLEFISTPPKVIKINGI